MGLTPASERPIHSFKTPVAYAGYRVLDPEGNEIGSVRELFKSADEGIEYVEVGTGFLGLRSALIPVNLVAVDDEREVLLLR